MSTMPNGAIQTLASQPPIQQALTTAGIPSETAETIARTGDTIKKIEGLIKTLTGGSGPLKEPFGTGLSNPESSIQTVVSGLPGRQDISAETAKYATGAAETMALLAPLLALLQGAWQFLNGGGLGQLDTMLTQLSSGVDGGLGALAGNVQNALATALAAADLTLEDLTDPSTLETSAGDVDVGATEGISDETLPLGEFLGRVMSVLPAVGVPERGGTATPPGTEVASTRETVTGPDGQTSTVERITERINPTRPVVTDLVPSNLSKPPAVDLVSTLPFRHDPNPYANLGNPGAALANDLALASDLANIAGQQEAVAAAAGDLGDAGAALASDEPAEALRLCVMALLKGLAVYNFQTDSRLLAESVAGHAARWWSQFVPDPPALDPEIAQKLTDGTPLEPGEITAYNNAISFLSSQADTVTVAEHRLGSMPGSLVWAAIGDSSYSGTLAELVPEIPEKVAQREGLASGPINTLETIIFNLAQADNRVEEIPDLFLGADPRIGTYRAAVKRWAETVLYCRRLSTVAVNQLKVFEDQMSGGPLSFVALVKDLTLTEATFVEDLLNDRLPFVTLQPVKTAADFWDSVTNTVDIDEDSQEPLVVAFLTELFAAEVLLPEATGMVTAIDELEEAVFVVGGPLGTDLVYLMGVFGTLLRIAEVLDATMEEAEHISRTKALLESADTMEAAIERFPTPGIFGRIAEAL